TRIAIQLGSDLLTHYLDGVWFVEFSYVAEPNRVPQTVADVCGLVEQQGKSLLDSVAQFIGTKSVLLILDNCEHLLEACAQLTETLLRRCPRLRMLITSREALEMLGELCWSLPPLSCGSDV